MIPKKNRSISWKTALIIAVSLHVGGYLAISQYSAYKTRLAKELKEARESLYAEKSSPEWPQNFNKRKVITNPKPVITQVPSKPVINKTPFEINIPIPKITFVTSESPKVVQNKEVVSQPKQVPKPIKRAIPVSKPQPKTDISKPFSNPEEIPVRRATMVTRHEGGVTERIEETYAIINSQVVLR